MEWPSSRRGRRRRAVGRAAVDTVGEGVDERAREADDAREEREGGERRRRGRGRGRRRRRRRVRERSRAAAPRLARGRDRGVRDGPRARGDGKARTRAGEDRVAGERRRLSGVLISPAIEHQWRIETLTAALPPDRGLFVFA